MPEQIDVFYEGWGERWLWGKLVSSTALTGRPVIAFEYSDEAVRKGFELSRLTLPLEGPRLRRDFPAHQLHLPGPVYDALPDGWGWIAYSNAEDSMPPELAPWSGLPGWAATQWGQ